MTLDRAPLRRALLDWYAAHKRDLPWRRTTDAYAIWLSEVMLQQTRVEVVEAYWRRFLEQLPTLFALAAAAEDDVLALWSGLGYYRRARALHAAAGLVVRDHNGELPADPTALAALPGFGPYTTGAVASIAFGLPVPLIDGNVARVLTRLFAIEGLPTKNPAKRELWSLAAELLPTREPGTWNQALMELGALVCKPTTPACAVCPVAGLCAARVDGRVHELPTRPERQTPIDVHVEALVVGQPGSWLLARRPPTGRNPGLIELPTREASRPHTSLWPATWATPELAELYARAPLLGHFRHSITRHRITIEARRIDCNPALAASIAAASAYDLQPRTDARSLPLSGLTTKLLEAT